MVMGKWYCCKVKVNVTLKGVVLLRTRKPLFVNTEISTMGKLPRVPENVDQRLMKLPFADLRLSVLVEFGVCASCFTRPFSSTNARASVMLVGRLSDLPQSQAHRNDSERKIF